LQSFPKLLAIVSVEHIDRVRSPQLSLEL